MLDADSPYASAEILERRPAVAGMGWDYLVQMPLGEGHQTLTPALGSAVGLRQPLQPLTTALHQVPPAQQQPMSHSKLLQQQGQQQGMQVPVQPMSILPNNAAAQQQQQAAGPAEVKQIVIQQAISNLSESALPQQAPLIAESARMASSAEQTQLAAVSASQPDSALPDHAQASTAVDDTSHNHLNGSLMGVSPAIRSQCLDPSSSATAFMPGQQPAESTSESVAEAAQSHVPAKITQPRRGSSVPPVQDAPQAAVMEAAAGSSQHTSPSPLQTQHPAAAATPFATQSAPKQASSLSSLIPHAHHRPASAAASGQAQGQAPARTLGAGPSREGTPNPKGPAKWVHESTLPLWLVKNFEEKRRRDVAMVAARAAQQAQREANRSTSMLSARWNAERELHSSLNHTVRSQGCSYCLHTCAK